MPEFARLGPESRRRCRVALLPDCHVQPGRDALPARPVKRLYGAARQLLESQLERLSSFDADAVFLLGDTLDPADEAGLAWLKSLIARSPVPIHIIIGNHETYGPVSAERFHRSLGLPAHGNHVVVVNGVPFLMLATPDQDCLAPGTAGFRWLREQLGRFDAGTDLFCCAHFSLVLHPCVQGPRNDGMQVLWAAEEILTLLRQYPNVRGWIAGHKNVPSKVVRDGILHLLSPQLIQAPCAFRVIDIYANGILSRVHDIEQQDLARLSRRAYGPAYAERHGPERDRDFWWSWA
jgi:calcineurin-like phosphoesterase family protein